MLPALKTLYIILYSNILVLISKDITTSISAHKKQLKISRKDLLKNLVKCSRIFMSTKNANLFFKTSFSRTNVLVLLQ